MSAPMLWLTLTRSSLCTYPALPCSLTITVITKRDANRTYIAIWHAAHLTLAEGGSESVRQLIVRPHVMA